jgi:hypothetical protein
MSQHREAVRRVIDLPFLHTSEISNGKEGAIVMGSSCIIRMVGIVNPESAARAMASHPERLIA